MQTQNDKSVIGIFDSGVGGLSVLPALRQILPNENVLYLADQAHVPYGERSKQELLDFSRAIADFLLEGGSKLIVVACNTASAAALQSLRSDYPHVPFVGMEPAVKPAVQQSESGVVGVLATPSTFEGELYASVVERFGGGAKLLKDTCTGLVEEIEAGRANGEEARRILSAALEPMLAQGLDTVVLGCTHYPFAFDTIRAIVGQQVNLIDPAPAIANRVASLLVEHGLRRADSAAGKVRYLTTGDAAQMQKRIEELLGETSEVEGANWDGGELRLTG